MLLRTFLFAAVPLSLAAVSVFLGMFDAATTEVGLEFYAERPLKNIPWLMPFNTSINFAYLIVGFYWIYIARRDLPPEEQFFHNVFNWMVIIYGPAQLMRFLTQSHHWAIIDQYYTLPIFAWVIPWALHFTGSYSNVKAVIITVASILSYALTLVTPIGFEIALGSHIAVATVVGINCFVRYPSIYAFIALILAVVNCAGFVFLKLMDLHLPILHPLFERVSGHFLSKICDCLQIHYVEQFFYEVYVTKLATKQKEK